MSHQPQWVFRLIGSYLKSNVREEWQEYPDAQRILIENAYQQQSDIIELDDDIIYLKHFLQINKSDPTQRKSIKRISCETRSDGKCINLSRQDVWRRQRALFVQQKSMNIQQICQHEIQKCSIHNVDLLTRQPIVNSTQNSNIEFRRHSEQNVVQETYADNSKSITPSVYEQATNILDVEDTSGQLMAILSGSASGLASTGLQNFVKRYTNISLPGDNKLAWQIIEPHFSKGPPRIRLESVFEIIQQYIDPNLSLLDMLMTDTPTTDRSHEILAMLALQHTVITTNFDHLIEDAGRFQLGDDPNTIPFDVFCTEEHFKNAHDVINTGAPQTLTGLWKIHGTVAMWKNRQRILVRADDDGGPIVTLKKLSLTRESAERHRFLHYLLETRKFIIINYSATDDFDVTRWLKTVQKPVDVVWIQHIDDIREPVFWNGIDIANGIPKNIDLFDHGLIAIACAWHERGIADHLTIVTTSDSIDFLIDITQLNVYPRKHSIDRNNSNEEYPLSLPTAWQSHIVSGALLSHLSYFSEAKRYFDHAVSLSIEGTREYCIARLAAAEASIEIGDRMGRIEAMKDAFDAADMAPLSLISWAQRKSKLICAKVKRFVEKDGQTIALTELQQLLNQCGNPEDNRSGRTREVALEAAVLLAQLRRYLPSSSEPSNIAKQWIDLIPKIGLLHTKGTNFHELGLNKYQLATNIEELDDAINAMKEAIEIREELGHMRGLVASLNVLGSMQMRRADWRTPFEITYIKYAAEQFRRSIEYSDKHAAVFDQFQARIHLAVCLLRYPSVANTDNELQELINYFQTRITDDIRTQMECEFCLAMSVFTNLTVSLEKMYETSVQLFNTLADKYASNNDARLIRILSASRFNAELCEDWKRGQVHTPNPELTRDIITRKIQTNINVYWQMRISRAETQIPLNTYDLLQLLLDPLSP